MKVPFTPEQRLVAFWAKVDRRGPNECWPWLASASIGGRYGAAWWEGRMRPAHRVAYELLVGPIPIGLELDHLCSRTVCVNPAHLEPVTHRENTRRGQGWAGENARKATCDRHGSPLIDIGYARGCRACRAEANRAYRARKKEAAA